MKTAVEWLEEQFNLNLTAPLSAKYQDLVNTAKEMEKEQIMRAYDIGSNEGYDLAKIDDIEEGHYMKEPIEYYNETFKTK